MRDVKSRGHAAVALRILQHRADGFPEILVRFICHFGQLLDRVESRQPVGDVIEQFFPQSQGLF